MKDEYDDDDEEDNVMMAECSKRQCCAQGPSEIACDLGTRETLSSEEHKCCF